jgi:hypothetical protein
MGHPSFVRGAEGRSAGICFLSPVLTDALALIAVAVYSTAKAVLFVRRVSAWEARPRYRFVFPSAVVVSFHAPLTLVFEST